MDDLFTILSDYAPEPSATMFTAADAAKHTHSALAKLPKINHQAEYDAEFWAYSMLKDESLPVNSYIVQILRFEASPPPRTAFVFAEHTQAITSKPIRDSLGDPAFLSPEQAKAINKQSRWTK